MSKPETNDIIEFEVVPTEYVTSPVHLGVVVIFGSSTGLITVGQVHSQAAVVGVAVFKVVVVVAVVPLIAVVTVVAVVSLDAVVSVVAMVSVVGAVVVDWVVVMSTHS